MFTPSRDSFVVKEVADGSFFSPSIYSDEEHKGLELSTVYSGSFCAGNRSGFGKEYQNNRLIYSGSFLNDRYHGEGSLCTSDGKF